MNRRSFIAGLISSTSLVAASRVGHSQEAFLGNSYTSIQSALPIIRGDGIHDDTPGIQAFLNGLEFVDEAGGFRTEVDANGRVIKRFGKGTFFVPKGLTLRGKSMFTITGAV